MNKRNHTWSTRDFCLNEFNHIQTEEKDSLLICQSDKTGNYMRFSTEMSKLHEISAYSPLLFKSHEGESGAWKLKQLYNPPANFFKTSYASIQYNNKT